MEHYVTLFDGNFLPQGLALYESLERHAGPFTLWVLCIDDRALQILSRLKRPQMRLIALAEIETAQLAKLKTERTRAEYCWTLTPHTPKLVFERDPSAARVTYLDADLYLLKSPMPIFAEFEASGKSVLITEHAYDAEYDMSATSGQYCVQFITFVREHSEIVREWWAERCLEWCFARYENGKFGDQKYLDAWPSRFPENVHVLTQRDLLLAPWNARRFPYSGAIAWHFHGLRLLEGGRVKLYDGHYTIPRCAQEHVYLPYVAKLRLHLDEMGVVIVQGNREHPARQLYRWLRRIGRRVKHSRTTLRR